MEETLQTNQPAEEAATTPQTQPGGNRRRGG